MPSELRGWREREIKKIKKGLGLMYDDFCLDCLKPDPARPERTKQIQVAETDLEVVVKVLCPQLPLEALEVWVSRDRLNVIIHPESDEYGLHEISVNLPARVRPEDSQAQLRSGILLVSMKKVQRPPARTILVRDRQPDGHDHN